jgi:hypothetical protein
MSLCSVCQRRDSAAITTALRHGEPVRALARRYKIPKTTMLRHARHVPQLTEKESPPMERPTAESPELVDDVEMALGQLASQLVEVRSQLARTQAQLAGINREFATWRTEQAAQRVQWDLQEGSCDKTSFVLWRVVWISVPTFSTGTFAVESPAT